MNRRDDPSLDNYQGRNKIRRGGEDCDSIIFMNSATADEYAVASAKECIIELLSTGCGSKACIFASLYPYLKELGWKYAVDDHSHVTVFLAPWASLIDGGVLMDGHCNIMKLLHNFDFFVDGQSAVAYLRAYGFERSTNSIEAAMKGKLSSGGGRKRCSGLNVIVPGGGNRSQKYSSLDSHLQ